MITIPSSPNVRNPARTRAETRRRDGVTASARMPYDLVSRGCQAHLSHPPSGTLLPSVERLAHLSSQSESDGVDRAPPQRHFHAAVRHQRTATSETPGASRRPPRPNDVGTTTPDQTAPARRPGASRTTRPGSGVTLHGAGREAAQRAGPMDGGPERMPTGAQPPGAPRRVGGAWARVGGTSADPEARQPAGCLRAHTRPSQAPRRREVVRRSPAPRTAPSQASRDALGPLSGR